MSLISVMPQSKELPSEAEALALSEREDTQALMQQAAALRDQHHGQLISYSRKIFVPLTQLCRDVCHYCTFAQTPRRIERAYMSLDEVLSLCAQGAKAGCQEALLTLGEKPELRYRAAREALDELNCQTTLEYVARVAEAILRETGLIPHINAGTMTAAEIAGLRKVSGSMGIMLESASARLCDKGMPHYGSPDKLPESRLQTIELAGQARIPFTSGILIGIGETRRERIESLLELRRLHQQYGHIQEVIIQNFRAKPATKMAQAPEPDLEELLWTIAVARLVLGGAMNIQAPPNLSPGVLPKLVEAGINDWGGVSPLTPDHVNPEAPWPHLDQLAQQTELAGKFLEQRLTLYPAYVLNAKDWVDPQVQPAVSQQADASGLAKRDPWIPGQALALPDLEQQWLRRKPPAQGVSAEVGNILERCMGGARISEAEIARLFESRGADFSRVTQSADLLREELAGDQVSYVVNRNINYTNVCYFKCGFCAFSKGKHHEHLRGRPYDISGDEIARRCVEAWERGATEVCMQGGIHPDYTGQTYLDVVHTVRQAAPGLHIHAFSPLEVLQGAQTLGMEIGAFLRELKAAGLSTLPGTAAEVLHDEVRQIICPDKLSTAQWLEVMEKAHEIGLRSTATIMFGHVDHPHHWAAHLAAVRDLQDRTGGFTEFVPLPFVPMEAPLYLRGGARRGPSFRETVLMHAVARLVFHQRIPNIQASWVKMGVEGVLACLQAGANDVGGTLMNESITRAAGANHGQEWPAAQIERAIGSIGRLPRMRTTLYAAASAERRRAAFNAAELIAVTNLGATKKQQTKTVSMQCSA